MIVPLPPPQWTVEKDTYAPLREPLVLRVVPIIVVVMIGGLWRVARRHGSTHALINTELLMCGDLVR